jgi:outer membrane protein TolC
MKFLTIILIFATTIFSDTTTLSLHDALTRAIQNNPLVRIRQINTNIAETILKENKFVYEPSVKVYYNTGKNDSLGFPDLNEAGISFSAKSPTGTGIELFNKDAISPSTRSAGNSHQNQIGFTVTQALLQGLKMSVNLSPIQKAKLDIDISQEELAGVAARLLMDTERAYWNLQLSGEEVKIYQYSLDLAQRMLFEAEERLRTGGIAPLDLVIIKAEVASREKQLFDAQTSYRQRILDLSYTINAPEFWSAEIFLSDTITTLGEIDELSDHIKAAHKFRPDFHQAELLAQKGELDLAQTKNGLLPRLDFFITLQGTSYAESFSPALLPSDPKASVATGLTLQFPITNGAARQRNQRATYSLEQQNLSVKNFSRLLEYEIRSSVMEVSRAFRQIETAKIVSELQQQKMEAEQEKMNVGRSTGFAVLQVQRDLVSANLDEARAKMAYSDALLSLYFRDGTLLQRRGVE